MSGLAEHLAAERLVDLTQPLGPATPLWPGSTPFAASTLLTVEADGCYVRELALPEHIGTHLDAPAHFAADGRRVHELTPDLLVRPAAMLDVAARVDDDPHALVTRGHLEELEARDGRLERGSAALVRTGWDANVSDPGRYLGPHDALAFPGLDLSAAELLLERGVVGVGIDTLSTDPGASTTFPVHRTLLPAGLWQVEGLVGLDRLPPRGAWIVVAPLRLVEGSGTPARVFGILPAPAGR